MIYRFNNQVFNTFPEYKRALRASETRSNAYKYWRKSDDQELLSNYKTWKVRDLADYFKRTIGAIKKRIEKLTNQEFEINRYGYFRAILNNANPITGEFLRPDSIYLHPQIKKDIEIYLKQIGYTDKEES